VKLTTLGGIVGAALAFSSAGAMAGFNEQATNSHDTLNQAFDPNLPAPGGVSFAGTYATLGTITADGSSHFKVTYTFLGREAAYKNTMVLDMGALSFDNKHTALGTSFVTYQGDGLLDFSFFDVKGYGTANGDVFAKSPRISWGLLDGATSSYGDFDYIIGLNDSAPGKTRDYDDMVVGISVTAVPEPETYALMMAGLGCLAVVARRRGAHGG